MVNLTLAFTPSVAFKKQLQKILGQKLEIKVDKSLLGGVIITRDGRYLDLSLKKKISNFKF